MWLRIYTQRLQVFVFIYMYRYTELHVLCIFAYMYTEFTWMCVHGMIVSACTHVRGTGQNVSVNKCNHVSAGNTPREGV